MMNKHAQEILESIIEEFALCDSSREEMEESHLPIVELLPAGRRVSHR